MPEPNAPDVKVPDKPVDVKVPDQPVDVKVPDQPVDVKVPDQPVDVKVPDQPVDVKVPDQPPDLKVPNLSKATAPVKKYELPALVVSVLALMLSSYSVYKAVTLQEETARLAREQLVLLERDKLPPVISVDISPFDKKDTIVQITITNMRAQNMSLISCSLALLDPFIFSLQAYEKNGNVNYPILIAPHSSVILYVYGSDYDDVLRRRSPKLQSPKPVEMRASFAELDGPFVRTIGTFSSIEGFRSSKGHGGPT